MSLTLKLLEINISELLQESSLSGSQYPLKASFCIKILFRRIFLIKNSRQKLHTVALTETHEAPNVCLIFRHYVIIFPI